MRHGIVRKVLRVAVGIGVLGIFIGLGCQSTAPATTELPADAAATLNTRLRLARVSTTGSALTANFEAPGGSVNAEIGGTCKNGKTYSVSTGTSGGGCSTVWTKRGENGPYELDSINCEDGNSGAKMSCDRGCTATNGSGRCDPVR